MLSNWFTKITTTHTYTTNNLSLSLIFLHSPCSCSIYICIHIHACSIKYCCSRLYIREEYISLFNLCDTSCFLSFRTFEQIKYASTKPCKHSRINILQWILTKLGTYLLLRSLEPYWFSRSKVKGLIFTLSHPCEHSRINIFQWILTKLGTYLVLKKIWNPIDFQGQRSRSQG